MQQLLGTGGADSNIARALKFVLALPGMGTALVGTKTPRHVEANLEAARGAPHASVPDGSSQSREG